MTFITDLFGILKVFSQAIWTFLNLTFDRSWVVGYHNGIFSQYIPCHSRHRVYLQCHCQLKLKTTGRCNDTEQRVNIIFFFSKTHIDNQFLLWEWPEKCLLLWASGSPIQENPGTGDKWLLQLLASSWCKLDARLSGSSINLNFLPWLAGSFFRWCWMQLKQNIKVSSFPSSDFCSVFTKSKKSWTQKLCWRLWDIRILKN